MSRSGVENSNFYQADREDSNQVLFPDAKARDQEFFSGLAKAFHFFIIFRGIAVSSNCDDRKGDKSTAQCKANLKYENTEETSGTGKQWEHRSD